MPKRSEGLGLHRRRNRWYIRVRVPQDIRRSVPRAFEGREFIIESCRTENRAEATRYALRRVVQLRDEFEAVRGNRHVTETPKLSHSRKRVQQLLEHLSDLRRRSRVGEVSKDELEEEPDNLDDQALWLDENDPIVPTVNRAFRAVRRIELTPLAEVVDEYLKAKQGQVIGQTLRSVTIRLQRFSHWTGKGAAIGDVNRKTAGTYLSHMQSRNLAPSTCRDELGTLTTFFKWAITRGWYNEVNPFDGQAATIRTSRRAEADAESRRPWSTEELLTLFNGTDPDDVLFTVSAIGLYTGMRQREISSLRADKVKDGVIEIIEGKSKAARRMVPVHPVIGGLVDSLAESSTDGWLIRGLTFGGPDRRRGWSLSPAFSIHKQALGITDPRVVFHSLRMNFATALEQAGVPLEIIQALVGHERKALAFSVYSKEPSIEQKREAVEKVDYGKRVAASVKRAMQDPTRLSRESARRHRWDGGKGN